MENPKFQTFTGEDGQFYFRLIAANAEIILASEGYQQKAGCRNGIYAVKDNALNEDRYRSKTASDSQFYFVLTAPNNEVIVTSELYTTAQHRDDGIQAVMRAIEAIDEIARDTRIEDTRSI